MPLITAPTPSYGWFLRPSSTAILRRRTVVVVVVIHADASDYDLLLMSNPRNNLSHFPDVPSRLQDVMAQAVLVQSVTIAEAFH